MLTLNELLPPPRNSNVSDIRRVARWSTTSTGIYMGRLVSWKKSMRIPEAITQRTHRTPETESQENPILKHQNDERPGSPACRQVVERVIVFEKLIRKKRRVETPKQRRVTDRYGYRNSKNNKTTNARYICQGAGAEICNERRVFAFLILVTVQFEFPALAWLAGIFENLNCRLAVASSLFVCGRFCAVGGRWRSFFENCLLTSCSN